MIGVQIRQLREKDGYLLRQMAAILDVDATILSKMERGERPFKRELVIRIAELCGSDKDKMLTMWLADKVCNILGNEECAIGALELAKDQKRNE